jgi:glycosyltransferase involved in cell wall biosynthesis
MFTQNTSLIIPTRNRPLLLNKILKQLQDLKIKFYEILIIDSSDPNIKTHVISICKKYKVVLFDSKASSSLQRNIGLLKKSKKTKFFMFLDDDVIFFKNAFYEMNKTIFKYSKNNEIIGFGFNQINSSKDSFFEKIKKSIFIKVINLYSDKPGQVTKGGWHTKILNLKEDIIAEWVFTTASVFKSNSVGQKRFDLSFGSYSYLEDLDFSLSLTRENKKIVISHSSKFKHPLNIDRSSYLFGKIEILNRYKIVNKYKFKKNIFFFSILIRFLLSFSKILILDFNSFNRALGNICGILIIFFNKKV